MIISIVDHFFIGHPSQDQVVMEISKIPANCIVFTNIALYKGQIREFAHLWSMIRRLSKRFNIYIEKTPQFAQILDDIKQYETIELFSGDFRIGGIDVKYEQSRIKIADFTAELSINTSPQHLSFDSAYHRYIIQINTERGITQIPIEQLHVYLTAEINGDVPVRIRPEIVPISVQIRYSNSSPTAIAAFKSALEQRYGLRIIRVYNAIVTEPKVPNSIDTLDQQCAAIAAKCDAAALTKLHCEIAAKIEWKTPPPPIRWHLKSLTWYGLFCFGPEISRIDFGPAGSIIGIVAANHQGKSAIIDVLLWVLFNRTSRGGTKTSIINNQCTKYGASATIVVGDEEITITRQQRQITATGSLAQFSGEQIYDKLTAIIGTYGDHISSTICLQRETEDPLWMSEKARREYLIKAFRLDNMRKFREFAKEKLRLMAAAINVKKDAETLQAEIAAIDAKTCDLEAAANIEIPLSTLQYDDLLARRAKLNAAIVKTRDPSELWAALRPHPIARPLEPLEMVKFRADEQKLAALRENLQKADNYIKQTVSDELLTTLHFNQNCADCAKVETRLHDADASKARKLRDMINAQIANYGDPSAAIHNDQIWREINAAEQNAAALHQITAIDAKLALYKPAAHIAAMCEIARIHREIGVLSVARKNAADQLNALNCAIGADMQTLKQYLNITSEKTGIPGELLNSHIKQLEIDINYLLSLAADFQITIGPNLNFTIAGTGKNRGKNMEFGSGFQTAIFTLCMRAALARVGAFNLGRFMIIDERLSNLDGEHRELAPEFLKLLAKYVDWIVVISHVDEIIAKYDRRIEIKSVNGFSIV